jgi:hypothetical protein
MRVMVTSCAAVVNDKMMPEKRLYIRKRAMNALVRLK